MDPLTINRLGNIRHEEIVAWSEQQQRVTTRRWKLPNLFARIRLGSFKQERAKNLSPTVTDC